MAGLDDPVQNLTNALLAAGMTLATAESCTGGLIAMAITNLSGSSSVFERGFVTYSNDSKEELLNVSREILEKHGAVSAETAAAMVAGTLARSRAGIALSVTGIAGPGGGSADKPVGLVYIGWGRAGQDIRTARHLFTGDRAAIREQAAAAAMTHAVQCLKAAK